MSIAAVVPTRNEAATIGPLVRHLFGFCQMVIVADDSDDNTALIALDEGATVVDPPDGLGPAYLEAWKKIPDDWTALHCDAGGSHPISSIARVARSLAGDIVIGSRFVDGGRHAGPLRRHLASRVAATSMNLATPYTYTDWTSGLRRYSPRAREVLSKYDYKTVGHAWQIESLYRASQFGLRIEEVGIDYRSSDSQLSFARSVEAFKLWWSIAWS